MGSSPPSSSAERTVFESMHPLFRNSDIVSEGGNRYIQSRFAVQEKEYEAWKEIILNTKAPLNHEFLLLPQHTGYQHGKEFCSNAGTAINNYPYFPINLADEIVKRKPEDAYFKESELWYLLFALVAAKVDLRKHGYQVGDIRPFNVFINSDRKAKVVSLLSATGLSTAYAKAKNLDGDPLLLAPEDFILLSENAIDSKANQQSEVFSIGATVLSAGLLDDLQSSYDYKKPRWVHEEFEVLRDKWVQHPKYSEIFKSIILNLVNPQPEKRIQIEDLYRFVAKYESSIKAKEQFIISRPPENLESGVSVVRSKVHP